MKVYVAGISAWRQYNSSLDTFYEMKIRKGDEKMYRSGGRGDVERTLALKQFIMSNCDALMLCDLDQKFPKDALERLREHDVDMVSGHYMRRQTSAIASIWQWSTEPMQWPYIPYVNPPKAGSGLHRIATTGMGCVLIKREVINAVTEMLPPGASAFEIGKLPEVAFAQSNYGSDYRFFYLAQKLGYKLWGDPDVDCPHGITMWLTRDMDFQVWKARKEVVKNLMETPFRNSIKAHGMITKNGLMGYLIMLNNAREDADSRDRKIALDAQIATIEMMIAELDEWSPPPEFLKAWKAYYNPMENSNLGKIELPTFGSKTDIADAIENRDKSPEGWDEQYVAEKRMLAKRQGSANTLANLNGKTFVGETYSEAPGEAIHIERDAEDSE